MKHGCSPVKLRFRLPYRRAMLIGSLDAGRAMLPSVTIGRSNWNTISYPGGTSTPLGEMRRIWRGLSAAAARFAMPSIAMQNTLATRLRQTPVFT